MLSKAFITFAVIASIGLARAQSPTTTGEITIHTVSVGEAENQFQPDTLAANPGDIISFQFYPSNHSVIRAQYAYPCIPYEDVTALPGFFSGFQPVAQTTDNPPIWNLTINDTNPVFYYCGAPGSCIDFGMVGVINPDSSESITTQMELAKTANYMLEPGQPFPAEASSSVASLASAATATATATVTIPASSATSTAPAHASATAAPASSSSHLSSGDVAGIAIGAAAVAIIGGAVFFLLGRSRSFQDALKRDKDGSPELGQAGGASGASLVDGAAQQTSGLPPYQTHEYKPDHEEGISTNVASPETAIVSYHPRHGFVTQHSRLSDTLELGGAPVERHELFVPQEGRPQT